MGALVHTQLRLLRRLRWWHFLNTISGVTNQQVLAANVSDGGLDCRRHNNNNRLDTLSVQKWISEALQ